jgi:hypothetical protein
LATSKARELLKTYGLKEAMLEIDEACRFAMDTKNATALANLLQLKAKINGLIIDKMDHRISGSFQINISGINPSRPVEALEATDIIPQIVGGTSNGEPESGG